MANEITRMLPERSYDENDVINMFSLDAVSGEAGSLVRVLSADLSTDPVQYVSRGDASSWQATLGHATSLYPENPYKVTKVTATGQAGVLGITLKDVRVSDENGENLLYYPEKREELQCVVSGQAVPVATKGVFALRQTAWVNGVLPSVGDLALPAADGRLTGVSAISASDTTRYYSVGKVLATGNRVSQQDTDVFAGFYTLLKLEL